MAKYDKKSQDKVKTNMEEFKEGKLKSGSGKKVTNPKQAIAIGLSEARKEGSKAPKKAKSAPAKKAAPKKAASKTAAKPKAKAAPKNSRSQSTASAKPAGRPKAAGMQKKAATKPKGSVGAKAKKPTAKKATAKKSK